MGNEWGPLDLRGELTTTEEEEKSWKLEKDLADIEALLGKKTQQVVSLEERLAAMHKQLDARNETTRVWIQAETQARGYACSLERSFATHEALVKASEVLAPWMSAAISDPKVCEELRKAAIDFVEAVGNLTVPEGFKYEFGRG